MRQDRLKRLWLASCLSSLGLSSLGCDTSPTMTTGRLAGASSLVFRCLEGQGETLKSYPLERCGCVETSLNGRLERSLTYLSREDCLATSGEARVVGYLASESQGRIATLQLDSPRQINDVDRTIPGVTHIGVDGLISAIEMHPYGEQLLILRGPEGALSLFADPARVRPELTLSLDRGPLSAMTIWPRPNEPLPEGGSGSFAYLYAPLEGELIELDLDALTIAIRRGVSPDERGWFSLDDESVISRSWRLVDPEGDPVPVSALSVDAAGHHLVVSRADQPELNVIDLQLDPADGEATRVLSYGQADGCADAYLSRPLNSLCEPTEGWAEGAAPACADGLDNDEDGLIDREDPGCERESDESEQMEPERSGMGALCADGLDNDGDGLVDEEDPGCSDPNSERFDFERAPECADGIDNDLDGLTDYREGAEGDPDCLFAAGQSESPATQARGSAQLLATTLALPEGPRSFAYLVSPRGALLSVDLDAEELSAQLISPARAPLALELRRTGALASLFYVTEQGSLESVHLSAPEPLLTSEGAAVYARAELSEAEESFKASALYWVEGQRAYELKALSSWLDELVTDPQTNTPALPDEAAAALGALSAEELRAHPLELGPQRGAGDLQTFIGLGRYPLYQGAWNRLRDAVGQSPHVSAEPSLTMNGVPARFNPERHPALCKLIGPDGLRFSADALGDGPCQLIGDRADGSPESEAEAAERLASYVQSYEGVIVRAPSDSEERPTAFSISYEGALPSSFSESGRLSASGDEGWRLVDFEADFCALGVEPGDLFVAAAFEPASLEASADASCAPYLKRRPNEGLKPLRYRVTEVRQRGLSLEPDERLSYEPQLGLNSSTVAAKLATPLPPPPARCVAPTFSYQIHVADDTWLVANDLEGYHHPWRSEGGRCVKTSGDSSAQESGRARLGELYEGRWLSFQLGFKASAGANLGVVEGRLPMMVGARFDLSINSGRVTQRLSSVGLLPIALRWLPELDRLYVVDAATESAAEFEQIDPYLGLMRQVQLFE